MYYLFIKINNTILEEISQIQVTLISHLQLEFFQITFYVLKYVYIIYNDGNI
jgi:hypothetical protein